MQGVPLPYRFARKGRSWATLSAVGLAWLLCGLGVIVFEITPWLAGLIVLATVPGLWDLYAGTRAGFDLDSERVRWFSGKRGGEVALDEIDHVRLVTRLDLSVRAALVLKTGRKIRLPAEATPPAKDLEAALAAAELRSARHHFTIL